MTTKVDRDYVKYVHIWRPMLIVMYVSQIQWYRYADQYWNWWRDVCTDMTPYVDSDVHITNSVGTDMTTIVDSDDVK